MPVGAASAAIGRLRIAAEAAPTGIANRCEIEPSRSVILAMLRQPIIDLVIVPGVVREDVFDSREPCRFVHGAGHDRDVAAVTGPPKYTGATLRAKAARGRPGCDYIRGWLDLD